MSDPQGRSADLTVCGECDWGMAVPELAKGEAAHCPRCAARVADRTGVGAEHLLAWSTAAVIMLCLSLFFPFIRFETQGIDHTIVLLDSAAVLLQYPYAPVGAAVALCVVVLPGAYLLVVAYVSVALAARRALPGMRWLARLLHALEPWIMSDVFVVGVLVSLVKVISLAHIELGPSFVTFCVYTVLLLMILSSRAPGRFWTWLEGTVSAPSGMSRGCTASEQGVAVCTVCGALQRRMPDALCPRCGSPPGHPPRRYQHATLALVITAVILYVPAMAYPVMTINQFGHSDPQTILGGAWYLVRTGSWPVGLVVFVASVVVPIGKILALAWLCMRPGELGAAAGSRERTRLYRLIKLVGRWSMIDVFVVGILVALINAERIVSVEPGPGVIAFGAVVIVTMLATITFDPRSLWLESSGMNEATNER